MRILKRAPLLADFLARFLALLLFAGIPALVRADTRLPTTGTRGLTLPKGVGELGLAYRNTAGDYTFNLDGSRRFGKGVLVPFSAYRDISAVLTGAYGLTDGWELNFEVPYTWRKFTIDRGNLIDTENRFIQNYPSSRTRGLGDARFGTRIALHRYWGLGLDWKSASGADNFFPTQLPGERPAIYTGSGQSDLALRGLWDRRYRKVRLTGEAGYRLRMGGISNYLLREYNPKDEIFTGFGAYWQPARTWGASLAADYMHQVSPTSVSVLQARAGAWATAGAFELRVQYAQPVYGKDYPALFPEQLAEPAPLLGRSMEALMVYRWR